MKLLISIANYKIVLLFILPNMLIHFTLDRENMLVRFQRNCVYWVAEVQAWVLLNEEFFSTTYKTSVF